MNRREFLRRASILTAGTAFLAPIDAMADAVLSGQPVEETTLTLIAQNDVHSNLEPFPDGEFAGLGGAGRRAALIREVRRLRPNVLALDSGDWMQGTLFFNKFRGEAEVRAMSEVGIDAATLGNHEFDEGVERLAEVLSGFARFPVLNCNYGLEGTALEGLTRPSIVKEFPDGLRVGLIGAGIDLLNLIPPHKREGVVYRDPVAAVRTEAILLRAEERCHVVVVLSHINYAESPSWPGDETLARDIPEVDIVLGGHNHWMLSKPHLYLRTWGETNPWLQRPVAIAQSGWAGTHASIWDIKVGSFDGPFRTASVARVRAPRPLFDSFVVPLA